MLAPKKIKWRKQQKGKMRGVSKGATTVAFGEFGVDHAAYDTRWRTPMYRFRRSGGNFSIA